MPRCIPVCTVGEERTASHPQAAEVSKQGPQDSMNYLPMEITHGAPAQLHLQHLQGGHSINRGSTDHPVKDEHPSPNLLPSSPEGTTIQHIPLADPSLQNCCELYKAGPTLPSLLFCCACPQTTQTSAVLLPRRKLRCHFGCQASGLALANGQRRRRRRRKGRGSSEGRVKGEKRKASKGLCSKAGNSCCCKIRMAKGQHKGRILLSGLPTWREEGSIG